MEEKIYFEPENSGKKKNIKQKPKKKDRRFLKLFFFLLFLLIVVLVIVWLLKGSKTISGQYPENVKNESLSCESKAITYEKTNDIDSEDKDLKINMVFAGEDKLSSASLEHTLVFSSYNEAHSAEAISHVQFNLGLQSLGYDASKFNNKFSILDNKLVISLSLASDKSLDDTTRSYFLVDYTTGGKLPKTLTEYKTNYEKQGFSCASTLDQ